MGKEKTKTEYEIRTPKKELDFCIVKLLDSVVMSRAQIKQAVESRLGPVNKVTFDRHLENMRRNGWLIKHSENWKRGKPMLYSLHPKTIQAQRLDLLDYFVSRGTKKGLWTCGLSTKEKKLRNILFILNLMVVRPPLWNGYPRQPYDGISVDDITGAVGIGLPFGYTKLTKSNTEDILNTLCRENLMY